MFFKENKKEDKQTRKWIISDILQHIFSILFLFKALNGLFFILNISLNGALLFKLINKVQESCNFPAKKLENGLYLIYYSIYAAYYISLKLFLCLILV